MKTILDYNFSGSRALIRVDFNVPLNDSLQVTDDTRIRAAVPTIKKILEDGGSVILMSHLGRPKGGYEKKYSLENIIPALSSALGNKKILFANDCIGESTEKLANHLIAGEVLLLENLRFYPEEEKGDISFAKKLSMLGDFYINDAFGTAHRKHASTAVIAAFFKQRKSLGLLMADEVNNISKVLHHVEHPYVAVIGGAKVSSKLNILKNLVDKVDHFIIGGGMVFTFIKAMGGRIGNSLVENDMVSEAEEIISLCVKNGVKIHLPVDSICSTVFGENGETKHFNTNEIEDGFMGLDIGPSAIEQFKIVLMAAKTILWNGPMGVFEMSSFEKGTQAVGQAIASATKAGAFSLVGGGDSVAAVNKYHLSDEMSYVSTGGGAMLEFMEGITLPGITAIEDNL